MLFRLVRCPRSFVCVCVYLPTLSILYQFIRMPAVRKCEPKNDISTRAGRSKGMQTCVHRRGPPKLVAGTSTSATPIGFARRCSRTPRTSQRTVGLYLEILYPNTRCAEIIVSLLLGMAGRGANLSAGSVTDICQDICRRGLSTSAGKILGRYATANNKI